ncbi:MAG TPA: hypothetical protein PKA81_06680 [Clostridia bacterium]|nr:hypothetical protein [Clostridia bacterium]
MNEPETLLSSPSEPSLDTSAQLSPDEQPASTATPFSTEMILGQLSAEKSSYPVLPGLIGALLGSIPGVLAWVILGQVGFIAGICGWLMIRGAIFGYTKLAGGIDRRGEILSTIVALMMPIASEYLGLAVSIYRNFHESYGVTVGEAIRSVPLYLAEPDVLKGIILSLIIGYVLIAIGNIRINPKQKKAEPGQIPRL